jgi:Starch-binding associating with outer membrane
MKNNIYKTLFVSFVVLFTSCEDYLDINNSPNTPLYENISPDLTLSAALAQSSRIIIGDTRNVERTGVFNSSTNALGNLMMNSWAGNVNAFTGVFAAEYFSNVSTSFYSNIWNAGYINIANLQKIINYKNAGYENHKAIAQIMKVYYMQNIVDLYGDCPYSEAFKGSDDLFPAFDDDKAVYEGLFNELNSALSLINNSPNAVAVGSEDVMMGGNMSRWKQMANTLKLRLIVRQRGVLPQPAYVTSAITALGSLSPADFLQADVTINPGYNKSTGDRQNPFYAQYGFNISGVDAFNRNLICPSENAALKLNSSADPRRGRLFTLIAGNIAGVNQGANSGGTTPLVVSKLGPGVIPVPTGTAPNLDSTVGSSQNAFLLTLSETKFLLAEAAVFYPAFSSYTPETLFNEGVISSFVRLGVGTTAALSTTAANTYLTAINASPNVGWNSGASPLASIMYQKWVSLMCINAGESWIDYVRTGFPVTPNAIVNVLGKPKRLLYPVNEINTNSSNVPSQTAATAFASGPFWK